MLNPISKIVLLKIFRLLREITERLKEPEVYIYIYYFNRCDVLHTGKEFNRMFNILADKITELENNKYLDLIKLHFIVMSKSDIVMKLQLPLNIEYKYLPN